MTNQSAQRNCGPILEVLHTLLSTVEPNLRALDTASGTGQHVAYFAPHFPNITFQPSEFDRRMLPSCSAYAAECSTRNVCPAMFIDVQRPFTEWGRNEAPTGPYLDGRGVHHDFAQLAGYFDYMLNINMIHISPIECTKGLFANAGYLLRPGHGLLITYGAYAVDGVISPQSNVVFDQHLRQMDPRYGVRDLGELAKIAEPHRLRLERVVDMPANNKVLAWRKLADGEEM